MKKPIAMERDLSISIADDVAVSTTDLWSMFEAAVSGDIHRVDEIVSNVPALIDGRYDYTSPLHLAVREGHFELVRYLVDRGALDPEYYVHPFKIDLVTLANERQHREIAAYLIEAMKDHKNDDRWDTGKIDYAYDEEQVRFQRIVGAGDVAGAGEMLAARPDLAKLDTAFWGEGPLAAPANANDFDMCYLLMRYGAVVPQMSKWGARYYLKHLEMGRFLLANGMSANHMNWREFTLLHDVIFTGETDKARLLLERGADVNAIDDELRSTPLGWAAYWNRPNMLGILTEFGADPELSGAPWSTPLAWARKKGHTHIEMTLITSGATH